MMTKVVDDGLDSLFKIVELPKSDASKSRLPTLPKIDAYFSLPLLDEYASGVERLFAGASTKSSYSALFDDGDKGSDIGVRSDTIVGQDVSEPDALGQAADFWQNVYDNAEAGSSRLKVFQPLRTWDEIQHVDPGNEATRTTFLSEGSVKDFDAMVTLSIPMINLPKLRSGTSSIPPTHDLVVLLDLMMRSTLGTVTSDSLRWDKKDARFRWDQHSGRGMGIGNGVTRSAVEPFLRIGTGLRRLEIIVDSQSTSLLTPTHHALLHAVSEYLTFIKHRLRLAVEDNEAEHSARWIKWSSMLKDVAALTESLCEVMCWPLNSSKALALPTRASSLLTHVYGHVLSHLQTCPQAGSISPTALALAYLMSTSSQPLLGLLHQWLGLAETIHDTDVDPDTQPWSDLGITRTPAKQKSTGTDREISWEYTFSAKRMPGFIPRDVRRTLFEAGRSLRLLRDASGGQHPLCSSSWELQSGWGWGGNTSKRFVSVRSHVKRVNREIDNWRRSVRDRARPLSGSASYPILRQPRKNRKPIPTEFILPSLKPPIDGNMIDPSRDQMDEDALWALLSKPPGSHLTNKSSVNATLWAASPQTSLHEFLSHHSSPAHPLLPSSTPTLPLYISQHLLGPLITHSELVSTSLVSLYLDDLKFLDHMDVLHSFWLGGEVGFFERVSSALFGKEEAGSGEGRGLGRRARTRLRMGLGMGSGVEANDDAVKDEGEWGIGLGVGLSERERWPPGGGELAYALRTTLLDERGSLSEGREGSVWEGIEDRVSFAIKDLPDDESDGRRARWLNPQVIEALDFLYLAYSPPPTIAILLPQNLMAKYQTLQNFVLRISRVQKVLDTLFNDLVHLPNTSMAPKAGVDQGRTFSPSGGAVLSKAARTGIRSTSKVENRMLRLRFKMANFVGALGRYVLDTAIGSNWDTMRRRLERLKTKINDPALTSSRSSTPNGEGETDAEGSDFFDSLSILQDDEDDDDDFQDPNQMKQLHSIHSLVTYHHLTLDKIIRACLLATHPSQLVTFKVLMSLFSLVLDFGKVIKQVQRGSVGFGDGMERVKGIEEDWEEKEKVFMHALERLSLRSTTKTLTTDVEGVGDRSRTEHDLQVLLGGEGGDLDHDEHGTVRRDSRDQRGVSGNLAELLARLNLLHGIDGVGRKGRWAGDGV